MRIIVVMRYSVGHLILNERQRRDWDQAELARRLGSVGQQTVSRWEKGSRPRRETVVKLAALFEAAPDEWLQLAGYTEHSDRPHGVRAPVRPREQVLPVHELSPELFEDFVAHLGEYLFPHAQVSRYGGQGHKQNGIDVLAREGSRHRATFQCKRRAQFGPEEVKKAVAEVNLEAEAHYLVLSRRSASPKARAEMAKFPDWELWDANDLSRIIHTRLDLGQGTELVDTFFPGHREAFLGVAEPGPWLTTADFFRNRGSGQIYTQDWELVGRADLLDAIVANVFDPTRPVLHVTGRGGIGKSRLLKAVSEQVEQRGMQVKYLKQSSSVSAQSYELLPRTLPVLVVIDDAHTRNDLVNVLGELLSLTNVTVLLALRPYGAGPLASDLSRLGVAISDVPSWTLTDLSDDDAESLARQALGSAANEHLAQRLGAITADCPFLTVVAGVLIKNGQLDPACLDHEDRIRWEVLTKFRDVVVSDPIGGDGVMRRAVLDGLAILQPFRSDDQAFQESLVELVGQPYDRLVGHIRSLEEAGVVLTRGAARRIVPDLLGDVVLAKACFDDSVGQPTGYLERTWAAVKDSAGPNVFINANRMDWQLRHDRIVASSLTQVLWQVVDREFQGAGVHGRLQILRLLRDVAYFEPAQSFRLCWWATEHPTDQVEDSPLSGLHAYSDADVLQAIPPVLRMVAFSLEHLSAAANLLWSLATQDSQDTGRFPDHPLRVLSEMASYGARKPLAYNEALIGAVERWLQGDPSEWSGRYPLEVVTPMLATESSEDTVRGLELRFRPFSINPDAVAHFRKRIVDLALAEVASPDLRRALPALKVIGAALRYPIGLFARDVTGAEKSQWTPGMVETIKRLGALAMTATLDPIVLVEIRRTLSWHWEHSPTETKQAAREVCDQLPDTLRNRLALVLFDGWGQLLDDHLKDYEKAQEAKQKRIDGVVKDLLRSRTESDVIGMVRERLELQGAGTARDSGYAVPFLVALVTARPSIAEAICQDALKSDASSFAPVLPAVLGVLLTASPTKGLAAARSLLDRGTVADRRGVAVAVGRFRALGTHLSSNELALLLELAEDQDAWVRQIVAQAARWLAHAGHKTEAVTVACRVPFADSEAVADDVLQLFAAGSIPWRELTTSQIGAILDNLTRCPSLEQYWITVFLSKLSVSYSDEVVDLLMRRVEHWETVEEVLEYHPLPHQWHEPLHVRESDNFIPTLRRIRDWIGRDTTSWRRLDAGGRLFQAVAGDFDAAVLGVIEEVLADGPGSSVSALPSILRHAPRHLALDDVDFVRRVLTGAASVSDDLAKQVGSAMHGAVVSGTRMGSPGEPFPEDVHQRNRAQEAARQMAPGSLEAEFYRAISRSAEESIQWQVESGERLRDGRSW